MTDSPPTIRCRNLAVGYGGAPVLEDLTVTVEAGATLAVVGRSGCGKSTLLKTLAGILPPLEGEAMVLDATLPRSPPRGALGYIPQGLGLVTHATVLRNVLHGTLSELGRTRSLLGRFPESAERDARVAIESVGLAGTEHRRVAELSGGQRRRVAIARAFVQEPRVLLADEMLSELDAETARSIVDCLRALQAETGMTVVVVEHDLEVADEISDRLLRLEDGGIRTSAGPRPTSCRGADGSTPPHEHDSQSRVDDP
ncbi:phosphonate ABC transporter ATP-binding protein [Natrononativus amylolyticus]|uniref:phosphonate ABC transporter ATP-binding protein n=1 Tax=Natrononativus amylolyticus TaxID=2963434 RepID=UPI0020CCA7E7|nr:ATP-binding cassette domain-containing protein [Natrononativus amylolyticus]